MCGRYALHSNPHVAALQFGLQADPEFEASYNICPSTEILVIRETAERKRVAQRQRWGLVPGWAKDPAIGNKLANARGETVAEKPSFRAAFRQRRCLVPASGFYEWKNAGGRKLPWYIRPNDAELFGLAGITEIWNGPDGPLRTVSLVTTDPNELMKGIHDRMPVILEPQDYAAWLDPANRDAQELKRFLRAYPSARMHAHPVSTRVNTPKNNDPALIEPVA